MIDINATVSIIILKANDLSQQCGCKHRKGTCGHSWGRTGWDQLRK